MATRSEARPPAHAGAFAAGRVRGFGPLLTVWAAWVVLMAGANLATPLYAVYAERFGFSSLVLTSIFATYAFVLVPSLVLFGRLSDRFGRRPVILGGLAIACGGLALFAAATGTAWLYGARALQGLAVGMVSGAATAALVELDRRHDRRRAALFAGLAQAGGSAAGALVAGVLAEWAPDPRRLCFLALFGLTALGAGATLTLPEREGGEREPWRVEWPRVPRAIRGRFVRVSLTAAIVWATIALCFSIVPSYVRDLLHTHNLALLSAVAALALATSCVAQLVARRNLLSRQLDEAVGLTLLAAGLLGLVLAAPSHSLAVLVAAAVAAGAGHGIGFVSAQEELNEIAPPERRGEVTAAFIACIYFLVATGVISVGLLDLRFSLAVSVGAVALLLAAGALATAAWQLRYARR